MNVEVRNSTRREPQGRTIIFIDIKRQSDTRRKRLRCASDATLRNSKFLVRPARNAFGQTCDGTSMLILLPQFQSIPWHFAWQAGIRYSASAYLRYR
jgi:hypothetical protein